MTKTVPQRKRQTREEKLAELTRSLRATWQAWSALDHKKLAIAKRGGELLARVKNLVGHGEWLSWLGKHLPHIDVRTAQNWQRIWFNWNTIEQRAKANAKSVSHLGLVEALDLIRKPRPESEVNPQDDRSRQAARSEAEPKESADPPSADGITNSIGRAQRVNMEHTTQERISHTIYCKVFMTLANHE
jgi:Protein of unknown function (DUF3102)